MRNQDNISDEDELRDELKRTENVSRWPDDWNMNLIRIVEICAMVYSVRVHAK
jgi:hypothetical protein